MTASTVNLRPWVSVFRVSRQCLSAVAAQWRVAILTRKRIKR